VVVLPIGEYLLGHFLGRQRKPVAVLGRTLVGEGHIEPEQHRRDILGEVEVDKLVGRNIGREDKGQVDLVDFVWGPYFFLVS